MLGPPAAGRPATTGARGRRAARPWARATATVEAPVPPGPHTAITGAAGRRRGRRGSPRERGGPPARRRRRPAAEPAGVRGEHVEQLLPGEVACRGRPSRPSAAQSPADRPSSTTITDAPGVPGLVDAGRGRRPAAGRRAGRQSTAGPGARRARTSSALTPSRTRPAAPPTWPTGPPPEPRRPGRRQAEQDEALGAHRIPRAEGPWARSPRSRRHRRRGRHRTGRRDRAGRGREGGDRLGALADGRRGGRCRGAHHAEGRRVGGEGQQAAGRGRRPPPRTRRRRRCRASPPEVRKSATSARRTMRSVHTAPLDSKVASTSMRSPGRKARPERPGGGDGERDLLAARPFGGGDGVVAPDQDVGRQVVRATGRRGRRRRRPARHRRRRGRSTATTSRSPAASTSPARTSWRRRTARPAGPCSPASTAATIPTAARATRNPPTTARPLGRAGPPARGRTGGPAA